jgi:DNA-binding PadR family transcriptional regulator
MHHHHHHDACFHEGETRFKGRSRHGGFRGFRGFRPGMMGGRGGFPFGRFVGDGELRLIVLSLIAESPRHGYEIIKALEERSAGFYSPSPGVIYPTLTYLEEAGQALSTADGNKKTYAITDVGKAYLEENRVEAEAILSRIEWIGARLSQARHFFERGEDVRDRDIPDVVPELNAARRAIKAALSSKLGSPVDEQRRIAELLLKAAREIAGNTKPDREDIDLG